MLLENGGDIRFCDVVVECAVSEYNLRFRGWCKFLMPVYNTVGQRFYFISAYAFR